MGAPKPLRYVGLYLNPSPRWHPEKGSYTLMVAAEGSDTVRDIPLTETQLVNLAAEATKLVAIMWSRTEGAK